MDAHLIRAERIEFDTFARVCELHPELLERFVELGLLEISADSEGTRWFERSQISVVGRIRRLRSGFRLSYSSIAVVAPLIEQIDGLEEDLRRLEAEHHVVARRWPCTPVDGTDR